ncbi:MAG: ribosome biogenesis GTPase YlqF [Bacillales bacterium]|nr:ribosome biogenesis GTPase YlqF [Bacillales bacterium]
MSTIQWFPGHMAKAMKMVRERLNIIDAVIEVLDARAIKSSLNEELEEMIKGKPLLFILNKADMADKAETKKWETYLNKRGVCVSLDSLHNQKSAAILTEALELLLKAKIEKDKLSGKNPYPLKAMVTGIPNVGKSTLMNSVAKRKAMKTGDKPGVTLSQQFLRVGDNLLLLDNPGILWPKFKNDEEAFNLALIGSIKDEILPLEEVAEYGVKKMMKLYPERLKERYALENMLNEKAIIEEIGKKRGALIKGGEVDLYKASDIFLKELRSGKLGEITLERIS